MNETIYSDRCISLTNIVRKMTKKVLEKGVNGFK